MTDRPLSRDELRQIKKVLAPHLKNEKKLAQAIGLFSLRFVQMEADLNHANGVFLGLGTIIKIELLGSAIRNVSTRTTSFLHS